MPRANRHRRQESRSRRRRARRALNEFMLDDDDDDLFDSDGAESPSWSSGTAAEMGDPPSDDAGYVLAEAPKNR